MDPLSQLQSSFRQYLFFILTCLVPAPLSPGSYILFFPQNHHSAALLREASSADGSYTMTAAQEYRQHC